MLEDEVADRGRDLAPIERARAFCAEPLERLRELREAEDVALAELDAAGGIELPRPLQAGVDRHQDVQDVGLLGVDGRPLPRQPRRPARELRERHRAEPCSAASSPAAVPGTPHEAGPT